MGNPFHFYEGSTLFDTLQQIMYLPDYLRKDAMKNAVAHWREKSPLIDEVASGQTTFEQAVTAIVEENRRLRFFSYRDNVCNSPKFELIAKDVNERVGPILPLGDSQFIPRGGIITWDLRSSIDFPSWVKANLKFHVGLCTVAVLAVWLGLSIFASRDLFAYWPWAIGAGVALGLLLSAGWLLFGYPDHLSRRRELAEKTLDRAKQLDGIFQKLQTNP